MNSLINGDSFKHRVHYLFWDIDWTAEECASAFMSFLFGLWILAVAYRLGLTGPTLNSLKTVIPLWSWGLLGMGIGIYGFITLLDGRPRLRLTACISRLLFWVFLTFLTLQVSPQSLQFIIFIGLALLSSLASWKLVSITKRR